MIRGGERKTVADAAVERSSAGEDIGWRDPWICPEDRVDDRHGGMRSDDVGQSVIDDNPTTGSRRVRTPHRDGDTTDPGQKIVIRGRAAHNASGTRGFVMSLYRDPSGPPVTRKTRLYLGCP